MATKSVWNSRERGSQTVTTAVIFPSLLIATFLSMQAVVFFQADSVAKAAAQQGARIAAQEKGSAQQGEAAAHQFAQSAAINPAAVNVAVNRGANEVTATVKIQATSLIPGIKLTATEKVTMAVERIS